MSGRATVGDLLDALALLGPDAELGLSDASLRVERPGGRVRHVTLDSGIPRLQADDVDPSVIPDGPYCYRPGRVRRFPGGSVGYGISLCPHFVRDIGGDVSCGFLDAGSGDPLLWDQVKICGVRDWRDDGDAGREDAARADFGRLLDGGPGTGEAGS